MTKAAVLTEYGKPLEIWDIDWDYPLKFGQVRVMMLASGICGAQLQEIRGEKGNHLPRLMGHEGVGVVREIGPGVKTVRVDDKVVLHWRKGDGIESDNPEWGTLPHVPAYSAGLVTTFSQHTVISENRCTMVPRDTPVALCALLGCSLSTALGVLENDAKLKIGESLLIIGCGGLGMALLNAADLFFPSKVRVVDTKEKQVPAMTKYTWGAWTHDVHDSYDVVIDTTGDSRALEAAVERLNPSGRLVMVGQPREGFTVKGGRKLFDGDGFSIRATQGGGFRPAIDIPRYITLDRDFSEIITHRVSLDQINEGIELVRSGEAGRVLIEF